MSTIYSFSNKAIIVTCQAQVFTDLDKKEQNQNFINKSIPSQLPPINNFLAECDKNVCNCDPVRQDQSPSPLSCHKVNIAAFCRTPDY